MLLRILALLGALCFSGSAFAWNSANCPAGMIDMLAWSTPQPGYSTVHNEGQFLGGIWPGRTTQRYYQIVPADATSGVKFEINSTNGYPWDINLYDANGVYFYITGTLSSFTDPTSFSEFIPTGAHSTGALMYPRCVPQGSPGWYQYVGPQPFKFTYGNGNCAFHPQQNFPMVASSVWGPYAYTFGGNIPPNSQTVLFSDTWMDGPNQMQEIQYYVEGYGIVWWNLYDQNGVWKNGTSLNNQVAGGIPAYQFPCTP